MQSEANAPPLPASANHWALLIDIDGTLVDFAAHPNDVQINEATRNLLASLFAGLDGALAILSGRSLADVDRLLFPLQLPVGAVHGIQCRDADGRTSTMQPSHDVVARAHAACVDGLRELDGTWLESKEGLCLAMHFRGAPQHESAVRQLARRVAEVSDGQLAVQDGNGVAELKPPGSDKGTALRSFMKQSPFGGRLPIVIGDDLTDEPAFAEANRLGGFGVLVGATRPTAARFALPSPRQALAWLETVARALEPVGVEQ